MNEGAPKRDKKKYKIKKGKLNKKRLQIKNRKYLGDTK